MKCLCFCLCPDVGQRPSRKSRLFFQRIIPLGSRGTLRAACRAFPVPTYFTPQDQLWAPNASFFSVILHTPHDFTNQAADFVLQLQDESAFAQNVLTSNFGFGLTFVYLLKVLSVPYSPMPGRDWLSPWPGQPFGSACVSLMTGKCTCGRGRGKLLG